MKKYFVLMLVIGMILGLTNTLYAYPSVVTINSESNGCINFDNCDSNYASLYEGFFEANVYTFTVDSGFYSSTNSPDSGVSNWFQRHWFWSVNIYNPATGIDTPLGSIQDYADSSSALSNNFGDSVVINQTSDGFLQFYVKDRLPRDNIGSLTMAVTTPVVPEPISSILFLVGGSTLAARRFMRRKK